MLQISSTHRLFMAANDMTDALKHPQSDVIFTTIGVDTTTALARLAALLKKKFQKPSAPELLQAPIKAAENEHPSSLAQPILASPMKHNYQTRSQQSSKPKKLANVIQSHNSPLLSRVITPAIMSATPMRMPTRVHNLSPRNLSQDDLWDMENVNREIILVTNHFTDTHK
jgi:hypothetical protein